MGEQSIQTEAEAAIEAVSSEREADIILYNGGIYRPCDESLIAECIERGAERRRKNVILILVTGGGDPDAAFRIARCLQDKYERFSVYVSGICKSAGTLIAVGAHELIMSDHGELGPLDIQMQKKDEFLASQSGLTVSTALEALESRAFQAVERMFVEIENNTGGMLTVQTATDLASKTVVGLYAPIAEQIDPMHLGEAARALLIADAYGTRLDRKSRNLTSPGALKDLYTSYPSHGFVIDRTEASKLFKNVREPSVSETGLINLLGQLGRRPLGPHVADPSQVVRFLTEPLVKDPAVTKPANDSNGVQHGTGSDHADGDTAKSDSPAVSSNEPAARKGADR